METSGLHCSGPGGYHSRMKRRVFLSGALGVAAMIGGGWFAWRESSRKGPGAERAAPGTAVAAAPTDLYALTLPDLSGKPVAMESFRGKPMLVNFWATWCPPCVKEMPDLDALHKKYPGVHFVGIGIDSADNMRAFSEKVPVGYPLLVAGHGGIDIVRGLGNAAGGLPFTLIFDADGTVSRKVLGQINPDDLARSLDRYT
ncbi:Cytochrome c-type biogenesis protein ResA [plant metagenome]|uniref:Cytochrome c-type biogenesis protein ResA n=2 Tax=plant metagenome TaxID=1297885 RepID=A0A484T1F4_9ZZZZ